MTERETIIVKFPSATCRTCGQRFTDPAKAADHYFKDEHMDAWALPMGWLGAPRPWTLMGWMHAVRNESAEAA
jgi:hypothetical protein